MKNLACLLKMLSKEIQMASLMVSLSGLIRSELILRFLKRKCCVLLKKCLKIILMGILEYNHIYFYRQCF